MTWTAQIIDRTQTPSGFEVACVLSDGAQKFVQRFQTTGTLASLKQQIITATTQHDPQKAIDEVPIGLVVDLSPDVVLSPTPDKAQQAQAAWVAAYERVQALQRGVDAGVIPPGDKELADTRDVLASTCLPEYRGLL